MTFDPSQHLSAARKNGPQDYLAVKWRLVWFREEHPDGSIETECLRDTPESAAFKATVSIPGKGKATGHGDETIQDFRDFYTKAETKAIGRALAALGYGTQFVGTELDEGERIVDSPTPRRQPDPLATFDPRRPQDRKPAPRPAETIRERQAEADRLDSAPAGTDDLNPHPPGSAEHVLFEARRLANAGHSVPEVWQFLASRQDALKGDWPAVFREWRDEIKPSIERVKAAG